MQELEVLADYFTLKSLHILQIFYSQRFSNKIHNIVVVLGANDGTTFMTTHFINGGGTNDVVFAEVADITAPSVLAGGTYYWVSQDPPATTSPTSYVSSCAPTCNDVDAGTLVAWLYNNETAEDIYYKISTSVTCCSFKPSEPGTNAITEKGWQLYPNPSSQELVISNTESAGGSYSITNMLGSVQRSGIMAGSSTEVNVSKLAPGTYILKIQGIDGENVVKKFVKE